MSDRNLKPPSSRRYVHASTSASRSTTIVVSPYASVVETRPGTWSQALSVTTRRPAPPTRAQRRPARPRAGASGLRGGGRAEEHYPEVPGTRRPPRHIDRDGDDLVRALERHLPVEHPDGDR